MLRRSTRLFYGAAAAAAAPSLASEAPAPWCDLRSDTITKPSQAMREFMHSCYSPPPPSSSSSSSSSLSHESLVSQLEQEVAALAGKKHGIFLPSGSCSNLVSVIAHTSSSAAMTMNNNNNSNVGHHRRIWKQQVEAIVGDKSHIHQWEAGSLSVLGRVYSRQVRTESSGQIDIAALQQACAPRTAMDPHRAVTGVVVLENTHGDCGGRVLPFSYVNSVKRLCEQMSNTPLHCDGARLWNAAAALGVPLSEAAAPYDSVSLCLSKGLGAPVGSVLVADDDEFITAARRVAKELGADFLSGGSSSDHDEHKLDNTIDCIPAAAAGLFAVRNNVKRIAEDNANAKLLSDFLWRAGFVVQPVESNIVMWRVKAGASADFVQHAASKVGVLVQEHDGNIVRAVCNLHTDSEVIARFGDMLVNRETGFDSFM